MGSEGVIEHDDYIQRLSRGGTPSITLRDFISQTFSVTSFISPTIKTITKNVYVQSVSERVLLNSRCSTNFTCDLHKEACRQDCIVNMFFNNKQKHTNKSVE